MSSHKWKTTAVRWLDFSGEVAEKVRADGKVQPVFTILDCEDFMCIKYIAGIGRNQDAVLVSPAYIPHIFLNLISVCTA